MTVEPDPNIPRSEQAKQGEPAYSLALTVNGRPYRLTVDPRTSLLDLLRAHRHGPAFGVLREIP